MQVSEKGIDLIKEREGYRARVYDDGFGYATVGWGHRTRMRPGKLIRPEQAEYFLKVDLQVVQSALKQWKAPKPTQAQYDAMASLVFNIGITAFAKSATGMLWRNGAYGELPPHILMWDRAAGHKVPGLKERRESEVAQFKGELY